MLKKSIAILFFITSSLFAQTKVSPGADNLLTHHRDLIENKHIGLVVNQTSILSNGTHLVDELIGNGFSVAAIFSPEHGFRGNIPRGSSIENYKDEKTGIPIFSLYGKTRKPTPEMLSGIDLLIFDIQDVGARFYSYISTLYYVIEASIIYDVPMIILDRPNLIGGLDVEGPVIEKEYQSFVGIAPIPIRYGMTIGGLANYFNDLLSVSYEKKADLTIIKMTGWKREYYFEECDLPWVKPSYNMTDVKTAVVYPGMCLLEGTNISEGRGTSSPFLMFGAPFINSELLLSQLKKIQIPGIEFDAVKFTPRYLKEIAPNPKYENEECSGLKLIVTDRKIFQPVRFGVILLHTLHKLYPDNFKFTANQWIDRLYGNDKLRKMILNGDSIEIIFDQSRKPTESFIEKRKQYLLY